MPGTLPVLHTCAPLRSSTSLPAAVGPAMGAGKVLEEMRTHKHPCCCCDDLRIQREAQAAGRGKVSYDTHWHSWNKRLCPHHWPDPDSLLGPFPLSRPPHPSAVKLDSREEKLDSKTARARGRCVQLSQQDIPQETAPLPWDKSLQTRD